MGWSKATYRGVRLHLVLDQIGQNQGPWHLHLHQVHFHRFQILRQSQQVSGKFMSPCGTSSKVRSKEELTAKLGILSLLHTTTLNGSVVPTIEFSVVLVRAPLPPRP